MFFGSPGRRLFTTIGTDPIRGAHTAFGSGWVVAGSSLYKVASTGGTTLIGTVPGSGRVCIVNNDIQLVIMHETGWHILASKDATTLTAVTDAPTTA